MLVTILE